MTQAQRSTGDRNLDPAPRPAPGYHYDAGGHVAMLQANLARQLQEFESPGLAVAVGPVEKLIRLCSRAGGYAMLAMGYAIVGILIANWL